MSLRKRLFCLQLLLRAEELTGRTLIYEIRLRHKNTSLLFCLTGQSLSFGAKTLETLRCLQSTRSCRAVLAGEAVTAPQLPQHWAGQGRAAELHGKEQGGGAWLGLSSALW